MALAVGGARVDAAIQAAGVTIFPAYGTRTASPGTEISFRGIPAALLGAVEVAGSGSGGHSGVLESHPDGLGASFLPDAPFAPGETVSVRAAVPLRRGARGTHEFTVARPARLVAPPASRVVDAPESPPHGFRSRPDLKPPQIEITTPAAGVQEGLVFVAPKVPGGQSGPLIVDDVGEPVWFAPSQPSLNDANDFRVQSYHGQPVLTWWEGASPVGYGFGHFVIANGAYERIAEVRPGNGYPGGDVHEFLLTPRGSALCLVYAPVHWDARPVGGAPSSVVLDGIVQEVDVASGHVLFEWHSLDHIALEESSSPLPEQVASPWDYVHLNSIDLAPDGSLVISARHTNAIYAIDTGSGTIRWRLNGTRSDFAMGAGTPFAYQHDARVLEDGRLSLFDNAESDQSLDNVQDSRGMVLALDMDAMTAMLAQEFVHPTGILSVSQGNLQMLPNGNAFVGWGSAPVFSKFAADGSLAFNGRFPTGVMSYRAYRAEWTGLPAAPPDVAIEEGADGPTLHVSWNGATGVAIWRVLAGVDPASLGTVRSADRTGFETTIPLRTDEPCLAVQAVGRAGNVLGVSGVVWRS